MVSFALLRRGSGSAAVSSPQKEYSNKRDRERFKWRIDGFSSLLDKGEGWTCSRVFEINGLNWSLNLYPRYKTGGGKECVYLALQLTRASQRYGTVVRAVFKFFIYDQNCGGHVEKQVTHHFQTLSPFSPFMYMIPLETLENPSSGLFINDSCIFGVEFIKVAAAKTTGAISQSLQYFISGCLYKRNEKRFKWRIDGFSSLLDKGAICTYSRVFEIKGLDWSLNLYPRDKTGGGKECVYLALQSARASQRYGTVVQAVFKFLIYDQTSGRHVEQQVTHHFQTLSPCSPSTYMIPLETLKDPSSGFLINDSCILGVEFIKVIAVKTIDAISENVLVEKSNTFDDSGIYTWMIEGFTTLQIPCTSPTFETAGHKWSISVKQSSLDQDGDPNFLSLFLKMCKSKKLPENSGILVEFSLSIKDQESGNHKKSKGRCIFVERNCSSWGYRKFISLEDFKDSSNGYLVKGKCYIEAEIAIVGSSIIMI